MKNYGFPLLLLLLNLPALSAQRTIVNRFGMEFERIEAGSMLVGRIEIHCPTPPDERDVPEEEKWTAEDYARCEELARRDSRPGFWVTIQRPYYLGKYEITQAQWRAVMGSNPSFFQGAKVKDNADQHPVEQVSWEAAQAFIQRLNELDTTAIYRLPTELEWEYAARAGADTLLSWRETVAQAWIQDADKGSTHETGTKKPNAWGLYDTLGNVWEWVQDLDNGRTFPDPIPPQTGTQHVLRGGSFISDVVNATYFFHGGGPGNGYDVGLRILREAKE